MASGAGGEAEALVDGRLEAEEEEEEGVGVSEVEEEEGVLEAVEEEGVLDRSVASTKPLVKAQSAHLDHQRVRFLPAVWFGRSLGGKVSLNYSGY